MSGTLSPTELYRRGETCPAEAHSQPLLKAAVTGARPRLLTSFTASGRLLMPRAREPGSCTVPGYRRGSNPQAGVEGFEPPTHGFGRAYDTSS